MREFFLHETPPVVGKTCSVKSFAPLAGNASDDTLGLGYARYACNLRLANGKITRAKGVGTARVGDYLLPSGISVGSGIKKAAIYKRRDYSSDSADDRLILHLNNGNLYEARIGVDIGLTKIGVPEAESVELLNYRYNGKDVLLIFDSLGNISVYDGSTVTTKTGPSLTGACVYNERIYGAVKGSENKLRCSSNLDPFDWTDITKGAGTIVFPDEGGAVRRAVACGDGIYVFRDYSVYRLTGYTDINDYTLTKIFSSHNPIYYETAGVWNDKAYFLCEDGFYSAKGTAVSSEWRDEFSLIEDKSGACGICYGGKYYVAAKLFTDGGTVGDEAHCAVNNGIIGIDLISGGTEIIRGADVAGFAPCFIGGKSYLFLVNTPGYRGMNLAMFTDDGKIYGEYPEIRWTSPSVTLGKRGEDVTVRKIHLRTVTEATLKVNSDGERVFPLAGKPETQTVAVNARGERVQIGFSSFAPEFTLSGFDVEYETVERRKYGAN